MNLLGKSILEDCKQRHSNLVSAIDRFIAIVEAAEWKKPLEVRDSFGRHVDVVGDYWIVDVGGKAGARVILVMQFQKGVVIIDRVFTDHDCYMKWSNEATQKR